MSLPRGVRTILVRRAVALVAACLVCAACSSSNGSDVVPPTAQPVETEPTPEAAEPAPTTSAREASVEVPVDGATDAWLQIWAGASLLITDPDAGTAEIGAVASDAVLERLAATFAPEVGETDDGIANSPRTFQNNPVITEREDGSVRIDDCLFVRPLVTSPSVWYSGVARVVDGEWQIEELTPEFLQGCTPAAMQEAVFQGYEAYWDARLEFWDPPDPDHPLVGATTTGSFNEFLVGLLGDDLAKGQALRGRSMNFPEIIEVSSEFQVVIFDCQLQDPERGLFDIETGERLDGIAPIVEGQKDVKRVTMRLVDGVWKVEDVQGQENRACEHAPTTQALPNI